MKNRYELSYDGSYYRIYFRDGSFFMVDKDDFLKVSQYSWAFGKRGYPTAHTSKLEGKKTIPVHKLIIKAEKGKDIDHISGDKLDNRKANLRVCTHQQNTFNQKLRCTNTTGYYGVSKFKGSRKYESYIHVNGKKIRLGFFVTPEEAAIERDKAAIKYFGEYARLNKDLMMERSA